MILAIKPGVLQAVKLIRETDKAHVVTFCGEKYKERRIRKEDVTRKLFDDVDEACKWMGITE